MFFCKEKKSKAEALESQIALCGELRGVKKGNKDLKKFYSPLNPAEGRTCTCKVLGINYFKNQAIFLKFVIWKVEWYDLPQSTIILCVVSVIRANNADRNDKNTKKQVEQAENEAEREDTSGLNMTELSCVVTIRH